MNTIMFLIILISSIIILLANSAQKQTWKYYRLQRKIESLFIYYIEQLADRLDQYLDALLLFASSAFIDLRPINRDWATVANVAFRWVMANFDTIVIVSAMLSLVNFVYVVNISSGSVMALLASALGAYFLLPVSADNYLNGSDSSLWSTKLLKAIL